MDQVLRNGQFLSNNYKPQNLLVFSHMHGMIIPLSGFVVFLNRCIIAWLVTIIGLQSTGWHSRDFSCPWCWSSFFFPFPNTINTTLTFPTIVFHTSNCYSYQRAWIWLWKWGKRWSISWKMLVIPVTRIQ